MAFQDAPQPPMTPELYQACRKAIHVIKADNQVLRAGRAMLFILEQIGWGYHGVVPRVLAYRPFIWFTELGYSVVARNRQLFSRFMFRTK